MGLHSSRDQIIPKYIDSYYVISENMKKLVKEIYPEIKEKIKLTGWPRIDLWKDFRYLSDDKIESIKKKYGKFILFSSDYSFTRKSNIYSFLKYLEEYNWSKDSTKYKFVKDQAYQTYNEFKIQQGFRPNEIIAKSNSLKGVLEPFSTLGNISLLKRAGFKDIMTVFKYGSFEGFLAIK